ncbi:hypothetical protein [uncultured Cohaesibacter sp.]|uniref:ABC transporter permease n=1 Tax=uncultured Cohaesibacter sp. TaxID=1002546 RepID=UPI0029C70F10|nr:hypothetical protein [uncultured Cohaesibacter sp.]
MIALDLAMKSIMRAPRPNIAAMIALISVLVPTMLLWSMKVGFIQSMLDELRNSPASLEIRVKGDYVLTPQKLGEIEALNGVGFVLPTARYLASRAFASHDNGRDRTPASLLPTGAGDPLLDKGQMPSEAGEAIISRDLAGKLGLKIGDAFEISTNRKQQREVLRIPLTITGIVSSESVVGQWALIAPSVIQEVEAFIDGFALPDRGKQGRPLVERPDVYSGLRLYADRIEHVAGLARAMTDLGFSVQSNAARIEAIERLDRILSGIVLAIGLVLFVGLALAVWSGMVAQLERLRHHVALLGLMGHGVLGVAMFFVFIGLFNALGGIVLADLMTLLMVRLGNLQFEGVYGNLTAIFALPASHIALINAGAFLLQLMLASFVALKSTHIRPGDLFRDY